MKSLTLLVGIVLAFSHTAVSQITTNPTNGNVGIGTINPDTKLEVNGNMKVDSCLVIRDSIIVDKDAHIKEEMIVDGKVTMNSNSVANANFKILGTAKMMGTTGIEGNMTLPNTNALGQYNQGSHEFILKFYLGESGTKTKGTKNKKGKPKQIDTPRFF